MYQYIIAVERDSSWFSETAAAFSVDFTFTHTLHAKCVPAVRVRYSREFHSPPGRGLGTDNILDDTPDDAVQWELVIDNNSDTYSPDPLILPDLKESTSPGLQLRWLHNPRLRLGPQGPAPHREPPALQRHAPPGQQTLSQSART